jgi:hypothetical protein
LTKKHPNEKASHHWQETTHHYYYVVLLSFGEVLSAAVGRDDAVLAWIMTRKMPEYIHNSKDATAGSVNDQEAASTTITTIRGALVLVEPIAYDHVAIVSTQ